MPELLHLTYSLQNIDAATRQFWVALSAYRVFAFSGEMGTGKTTFIHELCGHLQVQDTVSSPTFALINEYHFADTNGDNTIYHMDWYRLRDAAEAINTGMEDSIDQAARGNAYCFIEWPEKASGLLRRPYLWISIIATSPEVRNMTVELHN